MKANELGRGVWADNYYILHSCPLCGDLWSFRTLGTSGYWECWSCGKNGLDITDVPEFKEVKLEGPDGLLLVSKFVKKEKNRVIPTGFTKLDHMLGGLEEGALTVITGKRGEGKSTFCSQLSLNVINAGVPSCFYSGELSVDMFQRWVFQQAACIDGVEDYKDQFGATRYRAKPKAEEKIRKWLDKRLVMYDNSIVKSSERNSILERFNDARNYYDCRLFFVDNLMTAKYTESEKDYYRQQSSFVGQLIEFALQTGSHVVLVAHPKKVAENSDIDENDQVAGTADITNRASNVVRVEKVTDKERAAMEKKGMTACDSIVKVTKNREYGVTGELPFYYEHQTRRFVQIGGTQITRYGWEDL